MKKISINSPAKDLIGKLPSKVKKNLSVNEQIIGYIKSFTVFAKPNYFILTNYRVLFFDEKHIGRFDLQSIPFQKILQIKAHRGPVLFGEMSLKNEDETIVQLNRILRGTIESFINAIEIAYNNVAIEPIAIKRKKGTLSAEWEFNKPAEMLFRQQSTSQSKLDDDPLNQLKMRFVKGEISEEEYKTKRRILQEQ